MYLIKKFLILPIITCLFVMTGTVKAQNDSLKTALVIIDIQDFYFLPGRNQLVEPEKAAAKTAELLKAFREKKDLVIHIKHNAKNGGDIYKEVAPIEGEKVITKNYANGFKDTDLLDYLHKNKVKRLVIAGMMTQMCVEATTRAASDYGFKCVVIQDACATRNLEFDGHVIPAEQVHYAALSALAMAYAKVMDTKTFLASF